MEIKISERWIDDEKKPWLLVVALDSGEMLGSCEVHYTNQAIISVVSLYVDPEHRRKGVATAILNAVFHWATEKNKVAVNLKVLRANVPAVTLYAHLGFQLTDIDDTAFWLSRQIHPSSLWPWVTSPAQPDLRK